MKEILFIFQIRAEKIQLNYKRYNKALLYVDKEAKMSQETIEKVFSRDRFNIPKYQRDYAWKKENFQDLWEDLKEALNLEQKQGHFLGTLVVAPNERSSGEFDIIDGQQRITTIFMLLYALVYRSEFSNTYKIKYLLDKRGQLKLETQNQDFFKELLEAVSKNDIASKMKEKADTQGKQNLCEVYGAILDCMSNLEQQKVEKYLETLLAMVLMWLEEPDSGRAIRTFQSVNDRGVPLELLDKLKSLLIYYSNAYCDGTKGLDSEINNTFGDISKIFLAIETHQYISNIGNQQFSESDIFRYHAGSIQFDEIEFLGHYRRSSEDTYGTLKKELKKLSKSDDARISLESFIVSYIADLKAFYQAFLDLLNEIDSNPHVFKLFLLEKVNPYFYNSLVRLKIKNELDDELITLFAKADILFFKSGSSRDASAYNLINRCLRGKKDLKEEMIKQCKKSDVKRAIDNLIGYAYGMNAYHYVFFEQNCTDMDIDSLRKQVKKKITQEKEHIIPWSISENEDEAQAKRLGFDSLKDLDDHINSFGNLLSLEKTLNSKAIDKDLRGKGAVYAGSELAYIRRFDVENFNKQRLKERNEEAERWLKNEFFKDFLN